MSRSATLAPMTLLVRYLHQVRVYWEDTDAGGIVFYVNYLKFFERARTEWLRGLGLSQQRLRQDTGGMFVVTETALKYHAPARLDDDLLIVTSVLDKGRASLRIAQQATLAVAVDAMRQPAASADTSPVTRLLCSGEVGIGWVDATSLQPARIPTAILDVL